MEKSNLTGTGRTSVPTPASAAAHHAISRPAAPPAMASTRPSESSCDINRPRDAPIAARTASTHAVVRCAAPAEVGNVSARDHQHERDGAKQPRACRLQVAIEHRVEPDARRGQHRAEDLVVGVGIVLGEPRKDGLDLCACLVDSSPFRQSSLDEQPPRAAAIDSRLAGVLVGVGLDPEKTSCSTIISGTQNSVRDARQRAGGAFGATPTTV